MTDNLWDEDIIDEVRKFMRDADHFGVNAAPRTNTGEPPSSSGSTSDFGMTSLPVPGGLSPSASTSTTTKEDAEKEKQRWRATLPAQLSKALCSRAKKVSESGRRRDGRVYGGIRTSSMSSSKNLKIPPVTPSAPAVAPVAASVSLSTAAGVSVSTSVFVPVTDVPTVLVDAVATTAENDKPASANISDGSEVVEESTQLDSSSSLCADSGSSATSNPISNAASNLSSSTSTTPPSNDSELPSASTSTTALSSSAPAPSKPNSQSSRQTSRASSPPRASATATTPEEDEIPFARRAREEGIKFPGGGKCDGKSIFCLCRPELQSHVTSQHPPSTFLNNQ